MFSPGGGTIANGTGSGSKHVGFDMEGVYKQRYYELVEMQAFSPASRQFAYGVLQADRRFIVVNGDEGRPYSTIGSHSLAFGPDSQRMAYAARDGDKWVMAIDGSEQGPYESIGAPFFSPD